MTKMGQIIDYQCCFCEAVWLFVLDVKIAIGKYCMICIIIYSLHHNNTLTFDNLAITIELQVQEKNFPPLIRARSVHLANKK